MDAAVGFQGTDFIVSFLFQKAIDEDHTCCLMMTTIPPNEVFLRQGSLTVRFHSSSTQKKQSVVSHWLFELSAALTARTLFVLA